MEAFELNIEEKRKSQILFSTNFDISTHLIITTPQMQILRNVKDCYVAPEGEKSKTRKERAKLENWLLKKGCNRDSVVVAIGGGSLLDLVGFVTATFCRGISFISMPTTLLAMTDAAIGGKVGINAGSRKNYLGTFHFPETIVIDLSFLATLPSDEFLNGMAEVIKHALIASPSLLEFIQKNWDSIVKKESHVLMPMLKESISIKKKIVEEDPFDRGKRRVLNFGHTLGHAIESASHFAISHGQAVYRGMIGEIFLSMKMGGLKRERYETIVAFLEKRVVPITIDHKKVKRALCYDKKTNFGKVRSVILEEVGKPLCCSGEYVQEVPLPLLEEAIALSICNY